MSPASSAHRDGPAPIQPVTLECDVALARQILEDTKWDLVNLTLDEVAARLTGREL